jgi:hypothetical protein
MRLQRGLVGAVAALAIGATAPCASAQSTFHVKEFDYDKGNWVFETINAYQGGYSPRTNRIQWGHELGLAYAVTDWWLPKVLISFDKDDGQSYDVQRLMFENTFKLRNLEEGKDGLGFAWFQSIEGALNNRQTNATSFGPIITGQLGKFLFSTNTLFEKTFGQNREPGINFLFAGQARYEIMHKVKLALEVYTLVPEIGARNQTPLTGTLNRVGPAIIFEVDLPGLAASRGGSGAGGLKGTSVKHAAAHGEGKHEAPHAEIELGVLFGTTEYTPDVTAKANMHVKF